ncbi:MAG: hydantoinase B/oxoprolinase family protein [Thermoleophilia bacterium]
MSVDPVTLEVVRNRLEAIADEMELTLLRTSHSPIVKEALDASAALFDAAGSQVAQAAAAPIHLGMLVPGVAALLEAFPPETLAEGDVVVTNDPFAGGAHLPDLVMLEPVFAAGTLVGFSVCVTHHQEIGGRSPGSTPTDATEIFQEGLRIPPVLLRERGRPNETLLGLLRANVRVPENVLGDVDGQLAACAVGRRGLLDLVERHGVGGLRALTDELLDRAERLTRAAIERIPDGTYRFEDWLDNDGVELDRPVPIRVAVTIRGDEVEVDLTGSAPQARGPINCTPASTLSAVYYVLRVVTDPAIPSNAGCYRPVRVVMPEGSVVNARPPAAVNGRAVVVRRTVDALLGALAQALPERIPAASNGHPLVLSIGGVDPATGRAYVTSDVGTGGMGARPDADGLEAIQTDTSNAQNVPVEALELESPLRVGWYRLRRDSGGAGRFRGGLGVERSLEALGGEARVSHRGERHRTQPWGLAGGEPGASSRSLVRRADGGEEQIPSKRDLVLRPGDRLETWTTGGGGHGDPLERDPALVLADVLDGKVGGKAAAERYGVAIRDGAVDEEETALLREALAAARGPVTWWLDRGGTGREDR